MKTAFFIDISVINNSYLTNVKVLINSTNDIQDITSIALLFN